MTKFQVTTKFDGRVILVIVAARNSSAAVNKARRIWPCREILCAKVAA